MICDFSAQVKQGAFFEELKDMAIFDLGRWLFI